MARKNTLYSKDAVLNLHRGDYIVLHGYPFEGMGAEVYDVNLNTKYISLGIQMGRGQLEIQLPLDKVLYSIYQDFDEETFINSSEKKNIEAYGDVSGESMGLLDGEGTE